MLGRQRVNRGRGENICPIETIRVMRPVFDTAFCAYSIRMILPRRIAVLEESRYSLRWLAQSEHGAYDVYHTVSVIKVTTTINKHE